MEGKTLSTDISVLESDYSFSDAKRKVRRYILLLKLGRESNKICTSNRWRGAFLCYDYFLFKVGMKKKKKVASSEI